jgi:plastocyanin
MKRGLAPSGVCSALPITRRVRRQLSIVQYQKSRNCQKRGNLLRSAVGIEMLGRLGDVSVYRGEAVRIIMISFVFGLGACSAQPSVSDHRTTEQYNDGEAITVTLSNFSFDPEHIQVRAGIPVRLRLVNESNASHNFSAAAFFGASNFPPGSSAPVAGEVEVGSHQTIDIALVPREPGTYPLECTHFLHSTFGMQGTVEVIP